MAQDCFLTFGICRQMIMMQPGKLSILPLESKQWGSQTVALNGITQSFALPLTISYAMAAVMTMRSGDFPGYVACPYWTECTRDTIAITPDYETQQGYTGTGKSTVTWILLAI